MAKFQCKDCGHIFSSKEKARFCPLCGAADPLLIPGRSRVNALRLAQEAADMVPRLDNLWGEYVDLLADYELKMVTLRQYKHRGIIQESEMPSRDRETLAQALRRVRAERRSEK